ncbi:prepilin-type N-terminal cleavage/methylation domain-containing protein [Dechloromonas sp. HYN0024]|uniref:prepilin-type N-terminal cleavage/methylation domain-containing protein n=1 Tax=Dechloromonas sp. HYN0024 TaxID=2231055 RepID=UPI000E444770|nr:prepilin-type N-terminal cleavage/methylation domain-containing protein [Dechloromonas sp. HYN0024]AXS80767.1 prepilin-type N-terminal cleavage/methylation domain-containing protein [Dechloromonas sp. HYN0024]
MNSRQKGFTLVEIAIVLVIIGLLLGGVLKGQELINSAKVKNFANDFRNIPLFIYGYQDKFKALPGDDLNVATNVTGATLATTPAASQGNGVIDGNWDTALVTDESMLFWQHARLAGLASGGTVVANNNTYWPTNADGGRIGIESGSAHFIKNTDNATFLQGSYVVCSQGILGKFAKQLDTTMDDGNTDSGSMRVVALNHTRGNVALARANVDDATSYIVCMGL